ncbi:VOC family protein [Streptomyces sp. TRM 70351]|uniref:VOC family protein n=1 Tax=Streptomyces sp. TRM 70351 TaxID=3116552 RepID=UPI002E7C060D|nr:VOC family protein [Streptomyces sp. TRM 70351]MEE1929553.1 VOC family protein [Streptomyces sp. TRM 70351]
MAEPTRRPTEGTPCWADVMVADLAAAKRFYGELFGWTFDEPVPRLRGSYTPARLDGRRAAGLMQKADGRMPTVWTVYLATPDAAGTAERVRAVGGQVIDEPRPVGDGPAGVMAVAADPAGAVFGLWQPGEHLGFEARAEHGAYVWTDIVTRTPARTDAFYPEVFGYRPLVGSAAAEPAPEPPGGKRAAGEGAGGEGAEGRDAAGDGPEQRPEPPDTVVWAPRGLPADEEHAVVARSLMAGNVPVELPAHLLVYFAVDDCDAAAETVRRIGGRVTYGPETGRYGRWAQCADNQGAAFAVLDPAEAG